MLSSIADHSLFFNQPSHGAGHLQLSSHGQGSPAHSIGESNDEKGVKKADTSSDLANKDFSEEEHKQISTLKARDREVRNHEQAHVNAAGGIATSGPSFSYQLGPDGVRYATGGEVQIDTSAVSGDPAATIRKADAIRRAALAPAKPSAQDQSVAAQAAAMAAKAQDELSESNNQQANNPYDGQKSLGSQLDISV